MQKTFYTFLFLILFAGIAQAQVSIVPKAGVTFANVSDHSTFNNRNSLTGFTGGVGLNYSLSGDNFLSVQPELLYSQKGFSAEGGIIGVNYEGDYKLNYLELPLLVKIGFGTESIAAYVNAGPSVAYLLDGRVNGRVSAFGIGTDYEEKLEFTDNPSIGNINEIEANRIEFGLNFGGGIGFNFAENSTLFFDIRYNLGLTDYDKNQDSKNRVIALTAGVKLPL
jgi:opacity protein-like surface antigen